MTTDSHISEREREILRLIATGATNQRIAHELNISINTVKVHIRNIFGKIGVTCRAEAVMYAVRTGLVQADELAGSTFDQSAPGAPMGVVEDKGTPASTETAVAPPQRVEETDDEVSDELAQPPVRTASEGTGAGRREANNHDRTAAMPPLPRTHPARLIPRGRTLLGLGALLGIVGVLLAAVSSLVNVPGPTPSPIAKASAEGGGRWRELAPLPEPRAGFAFASYAYEGKQYLYVIGGASGAAPSNQVLRYDPSADLWVPMSAKPTTVTDVRAAIVGGRIYVPGGRLESGAISGLFEVYDPRRDRWATLAPLPAPRSGYAIAAVEGKLYLLGGWDGRTYRSEVWQYNPDDDTWRPRTPMPTARAFAAVAVLDQQAYVVGGENSAGKLSVTERYSPAVEGSAEPWSTKAPTSVPVGHSDATVAGSLLMLIGADSATGRLLVYNPQIDSWDSSQIPFPPLRDARVQSIGGRLYIAGGMGESGASARVFEYRALSSVFLPVIP